jgi:hypothetical protein
MKEEIEGYKNELKIASETSKALLYGLIKTRENAQTTGKSSSLN